VKLSLHSKTRMSINCCGALGQATFHLVLVVFIHSQRHFVPRMKVQLLYLWTVLFYYTRTVQRVSHTPNCSEENSNGNRTESNAWTSIPFVCDTLSRKILGLGVLGLWSTNSLLTLNISGTSKAVTKNTGFKRFWREKST